MSRRQAFWGGSQSDRRGRLGLGRRHLRLRGRGEAPASRHGLRKVVCSHRILEHMRKLGEREVVPPQARPGWHAADDRPVAVSVSPLVRYIAAGIDRLRSIAQ